MNNIKGCLFDLDGVIVDTAGYHFLAWRKLANLLGIDFTEQENEKLKGVSRIESLKLILQWGNVSKSDNEIIELADLKNSWYVDMITKMQPDEVLPGAKEFLAILKKNNYKIALGSASKNSETILREIDLFDAFDAIIDGNKVTKSKPDPEVFLQGAAALNLKVDECVVFEDAIAGVEAAINGNIKVVGIGSPLHLSKANLVIAGLHQMNLQKLMQL